VSHLSDDAALNIANIKEAVVGHLRDTDSRVQIEVTDHFNHSYVPDLILSWPEVSKPRSVFLRTSFDMSDLLRDVDTLADHQPILMPLARVNDDSVEAQTPLAKASRAHRTLITDPYGLEALETETEMQSVVSLFSHAVLQGGRGLVSSQRAQKAGSEVAAGFVGAQRADRESTTIAVETAEELLDSHSASQVNRLLHAVWVGSGAPGSSFPGAGGITAVIDAEALRFILELPNVEDEGFWSRVGRGLTTERLCELGDFPAAENLQRLLRGNAYRLLAKACRVFVESVDTEVPKWSVVAGNLALHTRKSRIHFAPRAVADLPDAGAQVGSLTVGDLRGRAARADLQLGQINLTDGDSVLSYGSETRPDISQDEALTSLQEVIAHGAFTSVVARIGGDRKPIRCTFESGTVAGNSSSRFYVSELALVALPLLADVSPYDLEVIREEFLSPLVTDVNDMDSA